jgi:enoyl-CoA hydratase
MLLTHAADAVITLTLNRPPVNAISEEWVGAFEAKLDELARGPHFTVLHIRSEQKVFCAGADLKEVQERMDAADGPDRMYSYVAGIQRLYARIERLPQVTLAEIGGAAMGGGFELALACDLRIAANEAKVGLPEVRLGLIPGAGGTQRLTRLCGLALAKRLILGAEVLDGATAATLGVVHWSAPRAELPARAAEIAKRIADLPSAALAASKACIAAAMQPGRGGYTDELEFTRSLLTNAETQKRVTTFLAGAAEISKQTKKGTAR